MDLWLLRRVDGEPGWDEAEGFVVVAPDEATARRLAEEQGGEEHWAPWRDGVDPLTGKIPRIAFWTDPALSSCVPLRVSDYPTPVVVLRSFNAG